MTDAGKVFDSEVTSDNNTVTGDIRDTDTVDSEQCQVRRMIIMSLMTIMSWSLLLSPVNINIDHKHQNSEFPVEKDLYQLKK